MASFCATVSTCDRTVTSKLRDEDIAGNRGGDGDGGGAGRGGRTG